MSARIAPVIAVTLLIALGYSQMAVHGQQSVGATPSTRWYLQYPLPPGNPVTIACPTSRNCYAAGTAGAILATADGGRHWSRQRTPLRGNAAVRAIRCPSLRHCTAAVLENGANPESSHIAIMTTANGGATWIVQRRFAGWQLTGLSCPTAAACYLLRNTTLLATGDGGITWRVHQLSFPSTAMVAGDIACPVVNTCYVDASEGRSDGFGAMLVTHDGGTTWQKHLISPGKHRIALAGMSCPSTQICYVADYDESSVLTTRDGWKTHAWTATHAAGTFQQAACADAAHCYVRSQEGRLVFTGDGGATWISSSLPAVEPYGAYLPQGQPSLACPAPSICLATQIDGNIVRTDSAGRSWTTIYTGTERQLSAIACAEVRSCLALGPARTLLLTHDGHTWSRAPYPPAASGATLLTLECRGTFCAASGTTGIVIASRDRGRTWQRMLALRIPGRTDIRLSGISCPSPTACFVDGEAYGSKGIGEPVVLRTSDGGRHWTRLAIAPAKGPASGVRCLSRQVCFVFGGYEASEDDLASGMLLLTRNGGRSWRMLGRDAYTGVACPAANTCYAVGEASSQAANLLAVRLTPTGRITARWTSAHVGREILNGVACTGPWTCVAVGSDGVIARTVNGTTWTASFFSGLTNLAAAACPTAIACYIAGSGSAILSTAPAHAATATPYPTATPYRPAPLSTPRPVPTATPAPTIVPPTTIPAGPGCPPTCAPGMLLYRADWSHGLDGWKSADGSPAGWHVKGGVLISPENQASNPATAIAPPFAPGAHGTDDYAITFQVRWSKELDGFHVSIRQTGSRYYDWSAGGCCTNPFYVDIIYRDDNTFDSILGTVSGIPMTNTWHTYRMEVKGYRLLYAIDGHVMLRALDTHLLKGGSISIMNDFVPLEIRSFEISAA